MCAPLQSCPVTVRDSKEYSMFSRLGWVHNVYVRDIKNYSLDEYAYKKRENKKTETVRERGVSDQQANTRALFSASAPPLHFGFQFPLRVHGG